MVDFPAPLRPKKAMDSPCLISKERLHSFTISEDYEHYWIGFDGELIDTLFDNFGLEYKDHQLFFVEQYIRTRKAAQHEAIFQQWLCAMQQILHTYT